METSCRYCYKVELQEESFKENIIGFISLERDNLQEWRDFQLQDPVLAQIHQAKEIDKRPSWQAVAPMEVSSKIYWSQWEAIVILNGVLYKKWESPNLLNHVYQILVPREKVSEVLEEVHDSPSGSHFGINKTLQRIRKRFYWATCKRDVEDWCAFCKICIAKKGPSGKGKSPLQVYNVGAPFERIQVDILGPLPTTLNGNRYVLVVLDCFTKWAEAIPLKNKRATTVAKILVEQVFSRHGIPLELHTDQGKNFESRLLLEMSHI